MRLLQSVLATLPQTRKPQRKFITHLLGLVLMLPGHATFRNLSRYSSCHERTFARWYDRPFDFVSLNKAAITQVIPRPSINRPSLSTPALSPKAAPVPMVLSTSGTAATGAVKKVWKSLLWFGSTLPTTVPMASVSSRHPQATRPLSHKAHASMPNLLERISQHLAQEHSLEKSSPDYQDLCNYGTITDRAA